MKNILILLLLSMQFQTSAQESTKVLLNTFYAPQNSYHQQKTTISKAIINFKGSDETYKELKRRGYENPTVISNKEEFETIVKTGKISNGKSFPLIVTYGKIVYSDGSTPPQGVVNYGKGFIDQYPIIDSVKYNGASENDKAQLKEILNKNYKVSPYPPYALSPGEYYEQLSTQVFTFEDVSVHIDITTIYIFVGLKNNIAEFKIIKTFNLNEQTNHPTVYVNGKGGGKILFDLKSKSPIEFETTGEINFRIIFDDLEVDWKTDASEKMMVKISPNPS